MNVVSNEEILSSAVGIGPRAGQTVGSLQISPRTHVKGCRGDTGMWQGEKVKNEISTALTPAPCSHMNEPDIAIKSGFVLGYSAINCSEVISLQIPGKADNEVKLMSAWGRKTI